MIEHLLIELHETLQKCLGNNFCYLVLFGSYARQEDTEESDIDLLVVLHEVGNYLEKYREIAPVLQEIGFLHGKFVSIVLATQITFQENQLPFYRNIRREGRLVA